MLNKAHYLLVAQKEMHFLYHTYKTLILLIINTGFLLLFINTSKFIIFSPKGVTLSHILYMIVMIDE